MALWTPADLGAKLIAWYDVSDAATITQSAGAVSQINNKKSGATTHLTQASGAAQPAYSTTSFPGSKPGITLVSGKWLENTSFGLATDTKVNTFAIATMNTGASAFGRLVALATAAAGDTGTAGLIPICRN